MKETISYLFITILLLSVLTELAAQEKSEKLPVYDGMILIPSGSFEMGSNYGLQDAKPVHSISLSSYYIDKYEVTNKDYKKCVDAKVCSAPSNFTSPTRASYYTDSLYNDYPVIYVNWEKAKTYCEWNGKRLPTEAEWEYAARGGLSGKKYPNGDTLSKSDANIEGNDTVVVGSYKPNGYGIYDMAGNVKELVNDWYDLQYYLNSPSQDPQGPSSGFLRGFRGGSWLYWSHIGDTSQVFFRMGMSPSGDGREDVGFRCAKDKK